jgi:hypothetical protein
LNGPVVGIALAGLLNFRFLLASSRRRSSLSKAPPQSRPRRSALERQVNAKLKVRRIGHALRAAGGDLQNERPQLLFVIDGIDMTFVASRYAVVTVARQCSYAGQVQRRSSARTV